MVKKRRKKIKEQKSSKYLLPIAIVLVLAVGVYAIKGGGGEDSTQGADAPSEGLPPLTLAPVSLPDYAKRSKAISDGYTIATQIPDVLEKIPCYCGCGDVGHESLRHCFIRDDGTFDEHASYCDLCMYESYETYEWYIEGVPLKEIRDRIDNKYGKAYGEGTDTPPV